MITDLLIQQKAISYKIVTCFIWTIKLTAYVWVKMTTKHWTMFNKVNGDLISLYFLLTMCCNSIVSKQDLKVTFE